MNGASDLFHINLHKKLGRGRSSVVSNHEMFSHQSYVILCISLEKTGSTKVMSQPENGKL